MVSVTLGKCAWLLVATATLAKAGDPTPEARKKWDDRCKAKLGQLYSMVFDSNGQPTGTCRAPPFKGCYWGPYKDPKTGQDGCCEKGNGVFSTDPVATLEGGCCVEPKKYMYDTNANKGGCCPQGTHLTWDLSFKPTTELGLCCTPEKVTSTDRTTGQNHCCHPGLTYSSDLASGQGECCEPGATFSFDAAAQKGDCCTSGQTYKVDPVTGKGGCCGADSEFKCNCSCVASDVNPTCPEAQGKIIQNGGKKWKIFCELINHGTNDISVTHGVASWGQCINNCAKNPKCVRAIWKPETKTCHLRSHGNKDDATFKDIFSSAHLVEGDEAGKEDTTTGDKTDGTGGDKTDGTGGDKTDGDKTDGDKTDGDKTDGDKTDDDKTDGTGGDKTEDNGADIGPPTRCPEVGGRVVTVGGVTYEIQCTKGIADRFDSYRERTTNGVGECMALCSADPRCQGANVYDDGAEEGCVMMKDWEYPASGSVNPTDNMMSFVPITKR